MSRPAIDEAELHRVRLARLRETMRSDGIELCVLTNPVSVRYATGYRAYTSFQSRIPSMYAFVPVDGPIVMHGAYVDDSELIALTPRSHAVTTFDGGLVLSVPARRMVDDLRAALERAGLGHDAVVGVERTTPAGHAAFVEAGIAPVDAEPTVELARSRKLPIELDAMRHAIAVAEHAIDHLHKALRPGITENELFSVLHQVNIAHDGDWIDGRMLCSGPRTNPWYQEASARVIERGDLVAFDTDMIGPFGYCADISRTFVCAAEPSPTQRDLYARARDEIDHNTELLHVGASFAELSNAVLRHPDEFIANRYACAFHGVGMTDEYPKIPYPDDWEWTGYDGEVEEGTVLAVESYVGAESGREGVKLEQMVLVTGTGVVPLSTHPLWDR